MEGEPSIIIQLAPLILIFVVFYFLLIRPQQKRMKEHREMLGSLRRGDRIATGGGIIGQIVKVGDDELTVEISEGVRVRVVRATVSQVLSKPEPARGGRGGRASKDPEPTDADDDEESGEEAAPKPERKGGRVLSRK